MPPEIHHTGICKRKTLFIENIIKISISKLYPIKTRTMDLLPKPHETLLSQL
jgi:hypothetical protein